MESIQYISLDPSRTEIRLIELLPKVTNSSPRSQRALRCNLIRVSLEDKPDYMALSYAWGNPLDTQSIIIGHSSVAVTRNLFSALDHLRYDKAGRVIWVDALCINQLDNEEKSWQVQLMGEIYQSATFVCVWLGPADTTSDRAMDFLHSFGTKAMAFGLDEGSAVEPIVIEQWRKLACHPPSFRDRSRQRVVLKSANGNTADQTFLMGDLNELYYSISGSHEQDNLFPVKALADLFTRSWWHRTWVLQEFALARKSAFVCGTKWTSRRRCTAALTGFTAFRTVIQERLTSKEAMPTPYQILVAFANFTGRPLTALGARITQRNNPLLALLRATCTRGTQTSDFKETNYLESTDPRDRIYGLLGLAADRDELKEYGIQPDYTQTCREVYISVTAAILRQGHLAVLSLNQFPKAQIGLPSWVPDWSTPLNSSLQVTLTDRMTLQPEYTVSGSFIQEKPHFNIFGSTASVSVSGFFFDEVYETGATWAEFWPLEDPDFSPLGRLLPAMRLLAEFLRLSFLRGKLYDTIKEHIRAASRTAAAEIGFADYQTFERFGNRRYPLAVLLLTMCFQNVPDDRKILDFNLPELLLSELIQSDGLQLATDMAAIKKYAGEIESSARGRKPFITAKGNLGLGPDQVELGDVIAVLIGCQTPFVLRKKENGKYEIVGEAYVDKIMDGEAAEECESVESIELF
jgi:hypothetical protein